MDSSVIETISLLGIPVHRVTMEGAVNQIASFVREGGSHQVITADASSLVIAQTDPEFREIIKRADLVTADGAGLLWAARRTGRAFPERVSGVDLVDRLCGQAAEKGFRLCFIGASPGVAETAARRMGARYPGCHIVFTRDGYFKPEEEPQIVRQIQAAQPDVVFAALGMPKQEKWLARRRQELGAPVLVGVGGSFDVLSGNVRRAPLWLRKRNLEWFWRLILNPRKIVKVKTLPRFVWLVLRSQRAGS